MKNKYFGTDGIRGTVNKGNITGEKFFKFGLASGTYFKNQKKSKQVAVIAKDTRLSGYTLEPALVSGLVSGGMHMFTFAITYKWACNADKIYESKYGDNDYRISQSICR